MKTLDLLLPQILSVQTISETGNNTSSLYIRIVCIRARTLWTNTIIRCIRDISRKVESSREVISNLFKDENKPFVINLYIDISIFQ